MPCRRRRQQRGRRGSRFSGACATMRECSVSHPTDRRRTAAPVARRGRVRDEHARLQQPAAEGGVPRRQVRQDGCVGAAGGVRVARVPDAAPGRSDCSDPIAAASHRPSAAPPQARTRWASPRQCGARCRRCTTSASATATASPTATSRTSPSPSTSPASRCDAGLCPRERAVAMHTHAHAVVPQSHRYHR
jgi:hypothetical protein